MTNANTKNNFTKKTKKDPRKITQQYLHNAGLYYLERYSSSVENFRRVMGRKIEKSCAFHEDANKADHYESLDIVIDKFKTYNYLNDTAYTKTKIRSMRRQGTSKNMIILKLSQKGLERDFIADLIKEHDKDNHDPFRAEQEDDKYSAELAAAIKTVRKKKLGVFRKIKEGDDLYHLKQKDLAAMARAGYSYQTSQKALSISAQSLQNKDIK